MPIWVVWLFYLSSNWRFLLHPKWLFLLSANTSQHLCEKLGMRREGVFLEFISFVTNPDGTPRYENTVQYAILKKEWDRQQSQ